MRDNSFLIERIYEARFGEKLPSHPAQTAQCREQQRKFIDDLKKSEIFGAPEYSSSRFSTPYWIGLKPGSGAYGKYMHYLEWVLKTQQPEADLKACTEIIDEMRSFYHVSLTSPHITSIDASVSLDVLKNKARDILDMFEFTANEVTYVADNTGRFIEMWEIYNSIPEVGRELYAAIDCLPAQERHVFSGVLSLLAQGSEAAQPAPYALKGLGFSTEQIKHITQSDFQLLKKYVDIASIGDFEIVANILEKIEAKPPVQKLSFDLAIGVLAC